MDEDEDLDAPTYLIDEYGELMTLEDTKRYWELVENVMRHTREGTRGRLPSIFMKYVPRSSTHPFLFANSHSFPIGESYALRATLKDEKLTVLRL